MRRRILLSLMTIAVVATIIGIGGWAVFNDTEEAGRYTAQAGTLDLDLDTSGVVSTQIDDLKPSMWRYLGPFWLHNNGSNPGGLDLHFMNVVDDSGIDTEPECEATWGYLDSGTNSCAGDWYVPVDDISNWIDVDYYISGPFDEMESNGTCPAEPGSILGKLGDIQSRAWDLGTVMDESKWYLVCLSFHLEKDAGNEYQGDTSAFDIVFTLHQTNQPADRETVRLENKDASWKVIGGDNVYGSVTYEVNANGNLEMQVRVNGLTPNTWHQLTLNGQDDDVCDDTDDQLASGSEKYAAYDSGFWDGVGPYINQGSCDGDNNEGVYNFAYRKTDANGDWSGTIVVANSHESDPADAGKVTATNPALPVGVYSDVKFVVKETDATSAGELPGTSWTPVLFEMQTLDFNLP